MSVLLGAAALEPERLNPFGRPAEWWRRCRRRRGPVAYSVASAAAVAGPQGGRIWVPDHRHAGEKRPESTTACARPRSVTGLVLVFSWRSCAAQLRQHWIRILMKGDAQMVLSAPDHNGRVAGPVRVSYFQTTPDPWTAGLLPAAVGHPHCVDRPRIPAAAGGPVRGAAPAGALLRARRPGTLAGTQHSGSGWSPDAAASAAWCVTRCSGSLMCEKLIICPPGGFIAICVIQKLRLSC